jgi:hypothetical protein
VGLGRAHEDSEAVHEQSLSSGEPAQDAAGDRSSNEKSGGEGVRHGGNAGGDLGDNGNLGEDQGKVMLKSKGMLHVGSGGRKEGKAGRGAIN